MLDLSQANPYTLTALDLAALRRCDRIAVVLRPDAGISEVGAIGEDEMEYLLPVPITVEGYWRTALVDAACFALIYNYPSQKTHASSVLATLKAGDAIRLHFYPDALSTPALRASRFHGDALYVYVYRKDKLHAKFQIAHAVCNVESVRMCRGFSGSGA